MTVPTIYDVAARAGVSIATVSFAFRRPEKVSAGTLQSVLEAARELGYVPSGHARGLASGRTGILGLCSYDYKQFSDQRPSNMTEGGDLAQYPIFIDEVQRGVQLQSWREGYALLVRGSVDGSATEQNESVMNDLATRVDGLAVFPKTVPLDVLVRLAKRVPVVALSEAPEEPTDIGFVTVDNRASMFELTNHLLSVHKIRKLAFVGSGSVDIDRRFLGFQLALTEAKVPLPEEPVGGEGKTPHAHQVRDVVRAVITGGALPDAFVCATDQHAVVVLDVLAEAGVPVPGRVAVTGFDDLLVGQYTQPSLTTVRQPMQELGTAAVRLIVKSLETPGSVPGSQILPTELIVRKSCGC